MKIRRLFITVAFALALFESNGLQAQVSPLTLHVATAGTLSTLIDSTQKNLITDLTLTGNLNGTDILYIREMAGRDLYENRTSGILSVLDLSGANIVTGGSAYYRRQDLVSFYTVANTISLYMFKECQNLTFVKLPNSVTSIGYEAFFDCTGLTSISIPNSVTSILDGAFYHCSGLTSITIPNKITSICEETFERCTGLTSITIPKSVTTIHAIAFIGCTGLTSIIIPNGVTSIGTSAFYYCKGLTSVIIGKSIASLFFDAFESCDGLTEIHCKMTTPPKISGKAIVGVDKTICKLYVPVGCSALYKAAGWGDFMNIIEEAPPQWNGTVWSPTTPTSVDDVTINDNYYGAGFSCNNLTINAGKQVSVTSGTLTVDGHLKLMSDASGTATFIDKDGTLNVADTTSVEQYVTGAGGASPSGCGWYFSSPLSATSSDLITGSSLVGQLWSHRESEGTDINSGWTTITSSANLKPMEGYLARMGESGVVTFTGGSLNTGTITKSGLTRTAVSGDRRGFNLVGNPYPSFLDWNQVTKSKVRSTIWLPTRQRDGKTIMYDTFDGITGTENGINGAVTPFIPPMQAFWILVDEDNATDGSITFTNDMRTHSSGDLSHDTTLSKRQLLRLQVSNGLFHDDAIVFFDPNASDDFDSYDSPKLSNDVDSVPEIYTLAGDEQIVINGLYEADLNKTFALGFKTGKSGTFTIKATEISNLNGVSIQLNDQLLNSVTDLTSGEAYTFSSDSTNTIDRFSVTTVKIVTGLNMNETPSVSVVSNTAGQIAITLNKSSDNEGKVSVYDLLGQKMLDASIARETTVLNKNLKTGIYLVAVQVKGKRIIKKVLVR